MFGHERGAFTGAGKRRIGVFETASSGTLLLDEITEIDVALQAKLLRVLQDGEIQRVGSSKPTQIDTRVVATTNRDPLEAVRQGHLREDLYYRLHVVPIVVPPLREHLEDLEILVAHFLDRAARRVARPAQRFSTEAFELLAGYDWPGNVRELANVVERAFTLSDTKLIEADLVRPWLSGPRMGIGLGSAEPSTVQDLNLDRAVARTQLETISEALRRTRGLKKEAQKRLGFTDRSTMRRTVQRLRHRHPDLWSEFPTLEREYGKRELD